MVKKSFSQKIATVFFFVNTITMIPAVVVLLFSLLFLFVGVISGSGGLAGASFIVIVLICFGILLFIGYCRHTLGDLAGGKIIPLWIGTLCYNALFLIPSVYSLTAAIASEGNLFGEDFFSPIALGLLITAWWLTACALSIGAMIDECRSPAGYQTSRVGRAVHSGTLAISQK